MFVIGIILGLTFIAALLAIRSTYVVAEDELALLTSFGRPVGSAQRPGLHGKRFWHRVHRLSLREQMLPARFDDARTVLAADGTPLRIDATVRYGFSRGGIERYLFGIDQAQKHVSLLFESVVRGAVANFGIGEALTSFESLRRKRRELSEELNRACASFLSERYGLHYHSVDVSAISPPRELEDALNAVLEAQAAAKAELDRASARAEQDEIAATHSVAIAADHAEAARKEIQTLASELDALKRAGTLHNYIRHRRSEVLSRVKSVFVRSKQ